MGMGRVLALGVVGLATLGCMRGPDSALIEDYRQQRDEALKHTTKVPSAWAPDLVLHLSPDTLSAAVHASLDTQGSFTGTVEAAGVELKPKLEVAKLVLGGSDACATCIEVEVTLEGTTRYDAGIAGTGKVPTTLDALLDLRLDTVAKKNGWTITAAPQSVRDLDLRVAGLPKIVRDLARKPLLDWVEANMIDDVEPVVMSEVGGKDLPLRALKIVPQGKGGVRVEALTDTAHGGTVAIHKPRNAIPWQLDVSADSLLWLARREAFAAGKLPMDIVAVPESLIMKGSKFSMGLRLWRVSGRGWWRDYSITGDLVAKRRSIELVPESVEQVNSSPGAVTADPLAALGQSVILSSIEDAIAVSLPARGEQTLSGLKTTVSIDDVSGDRDTLSIQGSLAIEPE